MGIGLYGGCFVVFVDLSLHQPSEARGRAGFGLPPLPPPPWGFAMRSSLSFASSCRDDACSPLRVCHLGWSVTGSLFALCGGAGRLRGCPSDGRGSEGESDWV